MVTKKLKAYYYLTKPGIIRGNLIVAIAGFLLASAGFFNWSVFFGLVFGVIFIIASGCVFNNYFDKNIDAIMPRTQKRALPSGKITERNALIFGSVLGVLGFLSLIVLTNWLAVMVGFIGWFSYVFVYTYYKKKTVHGTLIGTLPGATPPVAGYVSVTNNFDTVALTLFLILVFWQMSHFYAIAIFRQEEYKKAGIPVLSLVKGVAATVTRIIWYVVAFGMAAISLFFIAKLSYFYLTGVILITLGWLAIAFKKTRFNSSQKWARQMFGYSLFSLLAFSFLISLNFFA